MTESFADREPWPVLRTYRGPQLDRISLPIGGIGTGTIGLAGNGGLCDFEIGNRPAKGFRPRHAFFAIRTATATGGVQTRALMGPPSDREFEGSSGSPSPTSGLPRFRDARFEAAYPLGRVVLEDPALPAVELEAFNPLVPGDAAASSWPVAIYRIRVTNPFDEPLEASIVGVLENLIGANGTEDAVGGNTNELRRSERATGVIMTAPGLDPRAEAAGSVALAVLSDRADEITARTAWADDGWNRALLDFWDDFTDDGRLDERSSPSPRPVASVAHELRLESGETGEMVFVIAWNLPNRRAWSSAETQATMGDYTDAIVGNHYSVAHPDPWQTVLDLESLLPDLERRTVAATRAIVESSAPPSIIEAALFNISTLRSPTVFQTADGRYFGWEGVMERHGSCFGTCTHVWGYEFATSHWFADIVWSFREGQYELATDDSGLMTFRIGLPAEASRDWVLAAADGQMATLVHLYLDWRLSGDTASLARLWPSARRTLEFAWIPGGWDADQDGVMEGCQHNTMDVEYYGPNPQMGTWYLAALRACEQMAVAMGDADFAERCHDLFESGSAWLDAHLFTGTHYRQEIRPTKPGELVADGLRHWSMGAADSSDPDFQLGDGVLVDQLVGQYAARIAGLGGLLDPDHVAATLGTIFARNFRSPLHGHFTHMRSFALGDEAGLLMCSYEPGTRPRRPFPYFSEIMTGFEYTAATGMIQDGDRDQGLAVIDAIRARFDGARRNPFDEAECGSHYARAMASWSALLAWNDVHYDAVTATLAVSLHDDEGSTFWSTGRAWGTWTETEGPAGRSIRVDVVEGEVAIVRLRRHGVEYEVAGAPMRGPGERILIEAG